MQRVLYWTLTLAVLGLAGTAGAQCGDPNNLLTPDQCAFDTPASVGPDAWRAIPQWTPWDPNYGTVAHSDSGGRTSPGALVATGGFNQDPFGSFWVAGADICVPHATAPGDVIDSGAWVKIDVDPASLLFCSVNVTTANSDCSAGLDYLNFNFTPSAANTWTQVNAAGDALQVVTGGSGLNYNVSCWASEAITLTLDDAFVGPHAEPPMTLEVRVTGVVEWNQVSAPPLGLGAVGDPVEMRFQVTTDNFVDGTVYPTRGYAIDQSSFELRVGTGVVGLQNPFPPDWTPYFVVRNDDPAVDGFMLDINPDAGWPMGVPVDQVGIFGNFLDNFYVTYDGTVLNSLDLADAIGTWNFNLLEVYNWTIDDDGFNAIGIMFNRMTILEAGTIFADGFESGDLSAWAPPLGD